MRYILGIETSCDETGVAVFDSVQRKLLSNVLFSQWEYHAQYGGVVPEIASRSQLEKIDLVVREALEVASLDLYKIHYIAVTNRPGLVGSLLVGVSFAKALAWCCKIPLIGINHLEGHIFSPFLNRDHEVNSEIPFPHLSITASGGHTALYYVTGFGRYDTIAQTLDDAAGEAFDKIAKILGFSYPGGAVIERYAAQNDFQDVFCYPRTKIKNKEFLFSFSGLKTAVLYSLVRLGVYDLERGRPIIDSITPTLQKQVSSSLLVCIADIFINNIVLAFEKYPEIKALTFGGGVACNVYIANRLKTLCKEFDKLFFVPPPEFCTDNGGMIAFVGSYKAEQGVISGLDLDVMDRTD